MLVWGEEPIRIGARALDLLQLLIERQGELVSKPDLIRFAWPDTFVHESNLKVNIAALRRALQKKRDDLPHIITVSGRGYRFVVPVSVETASVSTSGASSGKVFGSNLPALPHPFGRDDDIVAVISAALEGGVTTIVGPAGVGKTTLAVAVARQVAKDLKREACFVDLAAISDPQLVCAAIASTLGIGVGLSDLLVGIVNALRSADRLVILDNCEHVLSATGSVAAHIQQEAPNVQIIATSREPLRVRSEIVYRLSPLPSPAPETPVSVAQAMKFPAVALFVTRARQATGYVLSESDAPIIADICRKLDGIPLAIELAAPRLQTHDATTLLQHLNRSIGLLNHGPRAAPLRHQALQTTLDWSYRLLSDAEAKLLRLLSVFAGVFSAGDACAVASAYGPASSESALYLAKLANKSLISLISADGRLQYRLLDATRSYARDKLSADGEYRRACEAHAGYLHRLFALAEVDWAKLPREKLLTKYGPRIHDLRKAIDWAFSTEGKVETGIALTAAAIPLWDQLSSVGESSERVRTALEASKADPSCGSLLQMKLATAHARNLAFAERLHPDAEAACLESVRLSQLNNNDDYELRSLWGLAVLQSFAGRNRDAVATLDRLDAVARRTRDHWAQPASARFRIMTEFYRGEIVAAHSDLQELAQRYDAPVRSPQASRFQIDPYVATRTSLAFVSWLRGDATEAVRMAALALDCALETKHLISESNVLALAAIPTALFTGHLDDAERHVSRFVHTLDQKGLTSWRPLSKFFGAATRHQRGDVEAVDAMQTAVDGIFSGGFLLRAPLYLGMLAEAALECGRIELARVNIERAIAQAEQQGEAWCRPELLRVLGRVERSLGQLSQAENTLRCAATLAGQTGALSFQLRAAYDLAVLWNAAGRRRASIALLDPICRRFPRDTTHTDVIRARSLLARIPDDEGGQVRRLANLF